MQEQKSSFPFSMVERMMPMYPAIAVMGWMFVLIAFLVGLYVLSPSQATFLSDAKAVREGATIGSAQPGDGILESWQPAHVRQGWHVESCQVIHLLAPVQFVKGNLRLCDPARTCRPHRSTGSSPARMAASRWRGTRRCARR